MRLQIRTPVMGWSHEETLTSLVADNEHIAALFVFNYKQPSLLQQRIALSADEITKVENAQSLRLSCSLPFWEALMLSCFSVTRGYSRLLKEAIFHTRRAH